MTYSFCGLRICYDEKSAYAASLFADEIELRSGNRPTVTNEAKSPCVCFKSDFNAGDEYILELSGGVLTIHAANIRTQIFGYAHFLRKSVYGDRSEITLIEDVSGYYVPDKAIRGHQLGYRPCNNTYDAWSREDYFRYYLDIMYFGANTCELIPYDKDGDAPENRNTLMKRTCTEALIDCCEDADKLNLDVSLWYPNDNCTLEDSVRKRESVFQKMPRLNALFIPGSDPGDYPPDELIRRVSAISAAAKKVHKDVFVWVSAQAPHNAPGWGYGFIREIEKNPDGIDGVIYGPNHDMPLEELRRRVPEKYPIRFYNDITHNVRCEHPVHFERDDWHFSVAAVNGREAINPRPLEFAALHKLMSQYTVGSCSYSEGVNDDVNKMLWSALDFSQVTPVKEILCDYARLFFPHADTEKIADTILMLEANWQCDCAVNPAIMKTLALLREIKADCPSLESNWRFNALMFRAECDALAYERRSFENKLIRQAAPLIRSGELKTALTVLNTPFSCEYNALRENMDSLAALLREQIGLQLDVEHFGASSWERGATLESCDLPITDRPWLRKMLEKALTTEKEQGIRLMQDCLSRCSVKSNEVYFSVALHGIRTLNVQQKSEIYYNFSGDNPNKNNGNLPMCMLNLFDSWSFNAHFAGLFGGDYTLRITYSDKPNRKVEHHRVTVNGKLVYDGAGYGGSVCDRVNGVPVPEGYVNISYDIPKKMIENGCVSLEITEPTVGFELCELWLTVKE